MGLLLIKNTWPFPTNSASTIFSFIQLLFTFLFFYLEKTLSSHILLLYSSTKISLPKDSNLKQYTLNNYCLFEIKKGSIMKEIELPLNCGFWSLWLFSQLQWDFAARSVANVYQKNGCKQLLQIWASKKCFTTKSQTTIHKLRIIHVI